MLPFPKKGLFMLVLCCAAIAYFGLNWEVLHYALLAPQVVTVECGPEGTPEDMKRTTGGVEAGLDPLRPLALAIVYPHFHGDRPAAWEPLRKAPRYMVAAGAGAGQQQPPPAKAIVYKPHEDLGYYDMAECEHRRFMRIMATRFGVHGFCFMHYWRNDAPALSRPLEHMLKDDEPRMPFVLCWDQEDPFLEPSTKADDDGAHDHAKHFGFLLPYFMNERYIKVDEGTRPLFFIKPSPNAADGGEERLKAVMEAWQAMAREAGLGGIAFTLLDDGRAPREEGALPQAGVARLEPDFALRRVNATASEREWTVQEGITLSMDVYNISQVRRDVLLERDEVDADAGQRLPTTWAEAADDAGRSYFVHSTFTRWNPGLLPRPDGAGDRSGPNRAMAVHVGHRSMVEFESHLHEVVQRARAQRARTGAAESPIFVLLNSWNDWLRQSALEPNDIDGYDALQAVKRAFMLLNTEDGVPMNRTKAVVHLCHKGGGTETHVWDLIKDFPEYNHLYIKPGTKLPKPDNKTFGDIVLFHIQSAMVFKGPGWRILNIARCFKNHSIPTILTVHDYQWFLPSDPNPILETLVNRTYPTQNVINTAKLFDLVDRVLFPDLSVYEFYREFYRDKPEPKWREDKMLVVPHNDLIFPRDVIKVPPIVNNTIRIGYLGGFAKYKGAELFIEMAKTNRKYLNYTLEYHELGYAIQHLVNNVKRQKLPMIIHGHFHEHTVFDRVAELKLHLMTFLSIFPETYSYALSRALRIGLPILYLDRGSYPNRLQGLERATPITGAPSTKNMQEALRRALDFVIARQNTDTVPEELSYNNQPRRWYLTHYPEDFSR